MQTIPWSGLYDSCIQCGQTDSKHEARGLCKRCYFQNYAKANRAAIKRDKRNWYKRAGGKAWSKLQREQRNYSGQRETVLRRDSYTCQKCGSTRKLCVHHLDGSGRPKPPGQKNNRVDNLVTYCRSCHMLAHKSQLDTAKRDRFNYWAPKYKLAACLQCGRSNQPHRKQGLCSTCIARQKRNGTFKPQRTGQPKGKWRN